MRQREPDEQRSTTGGGPSLALRLTRYGLPAAIVLAGVIVALVEPGETGISVLVGLVGVCACVVLWNVLLRLGASGDRDRDREAAAREYYDEHGRWPDEAGRRRPPRPGATRDR